jgi:serine/threonine protein kinase
LTHSFDLKIADFGLAVKLQDANSEQKTMCGTPNYISPEIVSRLPYGLASDTWSIGCMMVTMLTGSPPFQSEQVKSTLERVTRGEYTLPSNISSSARSMITSLIQKDPKRRPTMLNLLKHDFFHGPIQKLSVQSVSNDHKILPSMNDLSIYSNKFTENKSIISQSTAHSANYARSAGIRSEIGYNIPLKDSTISAKSASRVASSSTLATRYNSHNEPYYAESHILKHTNEDVPQCVNGIFCIN